MVFLYYVLVLPIVAVIAWLLYGVETSAEGISFYPYTYDCINPQVVLFVFLIVGYLIGKLNSFFNYLPIRRDLRMQRKANKELNQEHEKLNTTVIGLKQDIMGLQQKASVNTSETIHEHNLFINRWHKFKSLFSAKKDNI